MMRTILCGEVRPTHVDQSITVSGWVHSRRDHGGVLFIDLRDRSGLLQLVFNPEPAELFKKADQLRSEFVIQAVGTVRPRPQGTVNKNIPTGEVEVVIESLTLLNKAKTPPFDVSEHCTASEEVRLKNRWVDLRRPQLQRNMKARHQLTQLVRNALSDDGFLEIETPMLTRSTPEGARDFLVPARLSPGEFYALPQSPQIFKQILMVGGLDRYFQIARCFRDEALRADRQPEFTQIDIELSFAEEKDVMASVEKFIALVFKDIAGVPVKTPFQQMSYAECRSRFGTDRPDLRIKTELVDLTPVFAQTGFERFKANVSAGGVVKGILHDGGASFSRKEVDDLTKFAQSVGAKGLAWLKVQPDGKVDSPIAKFLSPGEIEAVQKETKAKPGDIIFMVSDKLKLTENVLGSLRIHLWEKYTVKGNPPGIQEEAHLLWVTDFPLFEWSDEEKRWVSVHHPFTSPRVEDIEALKKLDPEKEVLNPNSPLGRFKARAYDVVLNGTELGGGSVRVHDPEVQRLIFTLLGLKKEEYEEKFGFLLEALSSGAPPHAGVALGLDRWVSLLVGDDSIRDVIAFPKTQKGTCLVSNAPGEVDPKQLKELGIRVPPPPAKNADNPKPGGVTVK